ncbi:MAG TPA: YraN family protein [Candidatus Acidoferrales bacterium]|nr:YraN family protein [Candidatus Acidoferrales bacterium]
MFSRLIFGLVQFAARNGLYEAGPAAEGGTAAARRQQIRKGTGVRGETYAYWYLRRHGYVMIAKNYRAAGVKGEIDLVGYDGRVLAFVEVKTRRVEKAGDMKPEENVTFGKQQALARMARHFLREWRLKDVPWRFDLLAVENRPGQRPVVRLHRDAFRQMGPQRRRD